MSNKEKAVSLVRSSLPMIYLIIGLFALRWTVVEPYVVPTGSMEPTLKTGDRLYALKCAYDIRFPFTDFVLFRTGTIQRGDVILFRSPMDPSITFVKRAVGIPGDKISFREGRLFVNGNEVEKGVFANRAVMYDIEREAQKTLYMENLTGVDHYVILDNGAPHKRDYDEVTVPTDHFFAVGDNRDNSSDSRVWHFAPMQSLLGKAMFIWFSSWDWRVRPERIGTLIQ